MLLLAPYFWAVLYINDIRAQLHVLHNCAQSVYREKERGRAWLTSFYLFSRNTVIPIAVISGRHLGLIWIMGK